MITYMKLPDLLINHLIENFVSHHSRAENALTGTVVRTVSNVSLVLE